MTPGAVPTDPAIRLAPGLPLASAKTSERAGDIEHLHAGRGEDGDDLGMRLGCMSECNMAEIGVSTSNHDGSAASYDLPPHPTGLPHMTTIDHRRRRRPRQPARPPDHRTGPRHRDRPALTTTRSRVYYFGALAGEARALKYDPELLYAGAMFHDMGLTPGIRARTSASRWTARMPRVISSRQGVSESDIETVWTAIALHTTPGIPQHMHPVIALVTAGVEMDVLGMGYDGIQQRRPGEGRRGASARPGLQAGHRQRLLQRHRNKPETTFGNVKADVMAYKEAGFKRTDFVQCILHNHWPS